MPRAFAICDQPAMKDVRKCHGCVLLSTAMLNFSTPICGPAYLGRSFGIANLLKSSF
jgi:hypothetical protein